MFNVTAYNHLDDLAEGLAKGLAHENILLVLGSGISIEIKTCSETKGLPNWSELIERLRKHVSKDIPQGDLLNQAELIKSLYLKNLGNISSVKKEYKWKRIVKESLYESCDILPIDIAKADKLIAIATLLIRPKAKVRKVVTYNYDDLLEQYLSFFGFSHQVIHSHTYLETGADIKIFHPHGLLRQHSDDTSDGIVLTTSEYTKYYSHAGWRNILIDLYSRHYCIFWGLSGLDHKLQEVLSAVNDVHRYRKSSDYWGVHLTHNFAWENLWEERGVKSVQFESFDNIPEFILSISRLNS